MKDVAPPRHFLRHALSRRDDLQQVKPVRSCSKADISSSHQSGQYLIPSVSTHLSSVQSVSDQEHAIVDSTTLVVQESCLGRDPVFEANWMIHHPIMMTLSFYLKK
jgi:hypothetical protein